MPTLNASLTQSSLASDTALEHASRVVTKAYLALSLNPHFTSLTATSIHSEELEKSENFCQ
jgi:hypothetical protein